MASLLYVSLASFYFFYFAFVGAFSPYWGLYLKSLGFTAVEIGLLMSLLQVMRIFAPNLWGWIADHTGRRAWVVKLAAAAGLASYLGVFFGESFGWMFWVMALVSFFWSASLPLVEAITLSHLGEAAIRYGRIRSWGSLGFILAVIGIGYLLDLAPVAALLGAVLVFKLGVAISAWRIPESPPAPHAADHLPVWEILARPEVLALSAACLLMAAAHGPYYVFYSIYLVDHGYSKGAVGWLWAVGVICEIAVFFLMPRLAQSFTLKQILVASFGAAVVRFLLIGWAVGSPALMFAAQVLHAATFGAYHAAAVAVFHRFFRGRHAARGQAFYTSVSFGLGGTLGGLASGYTWEGLGAAATFSLSALAAACGMMLLAWKLKGELASAQT